ncbi:MAG: chromophore lyase CpcT/CpeT [Planctomycetota bacterium]|nr:chromophore lyase CpcT/CpeT [Planctomycetota bacterium]
MKTRTSRSAVVGAGLAAALWAAGCSSAGKGGGAEDDLVVLTRWMEGSFSSAEQAAAEPEHFRDVRLHMARVWPEREDGVWLYVEQAMASAEARPYRQRMYRLSRGARRGTLESRVYELPGDPLVYAGAWKNAAVLGALEAGRLLPREGCTITLRREGEMFTGSTDGRACASTLRGAAYATSEVTITEDALTSWDRGFDAESKQVWGAERGPYVFVKESGGTE